MRIWNMSRHCRTSRSRQSSVNGSQEDLIDRPSVNKHTDYIFPASET